MNQVLRMQNQLMQGFLVSENRLKEKQKVLSREVETQVTAAEKNLAQKQEQVTSRKESRITSIRSKSEKTLTDLKNYRDFAASVRQGSSRTAGSLPKMGLSQDPSGLLASTRKNLVRLQKDIQLGVPIDFESICQSVSQLVSPAVSAKKEVETKQRAYLQRLEQEQREIAQKNEEVALSILLMIASGGLIISMILFV
ncbi:hypothetical protein CMK12_14420 [Candidatus Poribacteria bacterium]|jgi:hypothetical protein|nr:hypothetical protein [Candidatus Poribacteria bacterium]MDP6749648.1 hypothetical protein [Candidatus Poribacteria bacterium]MDP6995008.1 hypothetical protein [Candidatus Poribacteria bacterium]